MKYGLECGLWSAQDLIKFVEYGWVQGQTTPIFDDQIQPASLDLRLGDVAWHVCASSLPGANRKVLQQKDQFFLHSLDLTAGAVLEKNCVYLIPLEEKLSLPDNIGGITNPKSSTGRLDILVRVITDGAKLFDCIPNGYHGDLYLEVIPRTFPIIVHCHSRLAQIRLQTYPNFLCTKEFIKKLNKKYNLINTDTKNADITNHGLGLSVYLGDKKGDLIGWAAKETTEVIDTDKTYYYHAEEFFYPIFFKKNKSFILESNVFYILSSHELLFIPYDYAAEMTAYCVASGEFRAHYAGFFDPGFSYHRGNRAVLEIRNHDAPFALEKSQIVARMTYAPLVHPTNQPYGSCQSHYQHQTLSLSKHFLT